MLLKFTIDTDPIRNAAPAAPKAMKRMKAMKAKAKAMKK